MTFIEAYLAIPATEDGTIVPASGSGDAPLFFLLGAGEPGERDKDASPFSLFAKDEAERNFSNPARCILFPSISRWADKTTIPEDRFAGRTVKHQESKWILN